MRKFAYLIIVFILPILWSCEKDDEKEEEVKTIIPPGWVKNDDLALLGKKSWYLYLSGNDSIRLEFYQFTQTHDYGGMRYHFYKKNNQGVYSHINSAYLHEAYSIENNGEKQIYGQGYRDEDKDYGIRYELIDNKTVKIYNLPGLKPFNSPMICNAIQDKTTYNDKNRLAGGWYHSQVVDSTILIFEEENIKEYLFIRGSSTIQDSWEYGDYLASCTFSYLQNEYIGEEAYMRLKEDDSTHEYSIHNDGNNLTIYWKSPGKTTTYKRIKK